MSALFILYKLCPAQLWISRGVLLFFPPLFDAGYFSLFFFFLVFPSLDAGPLLCHTTFTKSFFFCAKPGGFSRSDEGPLRLFLVGREEKCLPLSIFPILPLYPCDKEPLGFISSDVSGKKQVLEAAPDIFSLPNFSHGYLD